MNSELSCNMSLSSLGDAGDRIASGSSLEPFCFFKIDVGRRSGERDPLDPSSGFSRVRNGERGDKLLSLDGEEEGPIESVLGGAEKVPMATVIGDVGDVGDVGLFFVSTGAKIVGEVALPLIPEPS